MVDSESRTHATDIFPELGGEIDRRIASAETRLKLWVVAGIAANLMVILIGVVIPIYRVGQFTERMETAVRIAQDNQKRLQAHETRLNQYELREAMRRQEQ